MEKNRLPLKVLVLDVLKPHKPDIVELGELLCNEKSLESINITVYAVDERTETVKIVLEGEELDFDEIQKAVEDAGAAIHSVDKVILGRIPQTEQVAVKSKLKFTT